jgi:hypothetical protein
MLFETGVVGEPTNSSYGTTYAIHYGLTMPVLTDIGTFHTGLTGQYTTTYGMYAIPTTFVILPNQQDPANSIVKMIVGFSEDGLGPMIKDSLALGGFYPPKFNINGSLCTLPPYSATLSSNSATGNHWSTGETTQSIAINQSDTYTLTIGNGGCSTSHLIQFNAPPVVGTLSVLNSSICENGLIFFNYTLPPGSPNDLMMMVKIPTETEYNEYSQITGGQFWAGPIAAPAGTELQFIVRAKNDNGSCPTFSNQVSVTLNNSTPTLIDGTASTSSINVCPGSPFTLNYSGGLPNSVWEIYDGYTDSWVTFALADQPINPVGVAYH